MTLACVYGQNPPSLLSTNLSPGSFRHCPAPSVLRIPQSLLTQSLCRLTPQGLPPWVGRSSTAADKAKRGRSPLQCSLLLPSIVRLCILTQARNPNFQLLPEPSCLINYQTHLFAFPSSIPDYLTAIILYGMPQTLITKLRGLIFSLLYVRHELAIPAIQHYLSYFRRLEPPKA